MVFRCCLAVVLATAALHTPSRAQCIVHDPGEDGIVEQQVMVRVAGYSTIDEALAIIQQAWPGVVVADAIESRSWYVLHTSGAPECLIKDYLRDHLVNPTPDVPDPTRPLTRVELNYRGQTGEGKTGTIYIGTGGGGQAAALYEAQYAAAELGLEQAHARARGAGVEVAVLDTGADWTHPALAGRVLPGVSFVPGVDATDDLGDALDNDGDGQIDEMTGHGTFVSGLILLTAPNVLIRPIVVLNSDGVGDQFVIAKGIFHAIDCGSAVINLSLGSTWSCRVLEEAVAEAQAHGAVVVAAAGNLGQQVREYPAARDTIGVAALDAAGVKADFSNYNSELFISAPGDSEPLEGGPGGNDPQQSVFGPVPGDEYAAWEGTSFATAFVSGGAALVLSQHPEWRADTAFTEPVCEPFTDAPVSIHEAVKQVLACTVANVYELNPDYQAGHLLGVGRIDIGAAVAIGPIPGDVNDNNEVNVVDLVLLLANFGRDGANRTQGDLDGDGLVGLSDLSILLEHFGLGS
ncbi:MAG: S8 family serine peptidase [Phycisphaerae bacterium]